MTSSGTTLHNTRPDGAPAGTGRLAPSPTGRFHLGNLSTSLLAWVHARRAGHRLIRNEDLDVPRRVEGALEAIIADLEWLGLDWDAGPGAADAECYHQSRRSARYAEVLEKLEAHGLVYPCFCSRKDIEAAASAPNAALALEPTYSGACSTLDPAAARVRARTDAHAIRFRASGNVTVNDECAGSFVFALDARHDFVVRRRDGLFAYQLAVVVDDHDQAITSVVRGADLLDSTPRQFAIFDALGWARPATCHVPLFLDERGARFAKRDRSIGLDGLRDAGWTPALLRGALACLWGWADALSPVEPADLLLLYRPERLGGPAIRVPDALFSGPRAFETRSTPRAEHAD